MAESQRFLFAYLEYDRIVNLRAEFFAHSFTVADISPQMLNWATDRFGYSATQIGGEKKWTFDPSAKWDWHPGDPLGIGQARVWLRDESEAVYLKLLWG